MTRLVYYDTASDVTSAITREKQIKPWRREKKLTLIRRTNPTLLDLSSEIE
jgi:putative endonuclease